MAGQDSLAVCQVVGIELRCGTACEPRGARSDKHKLNHAGHHYVGVTVAADEEEPGASTAYDEVNQFPGISRDRFHRDVEKFAKRLIKVIKAQSRANFGGTQLESERNGSGINVVERGLDTCSPLNIITRNLVTKPKLKYRKDNKV